MLHSDLKIKIDRFLDRNALLFVVLGYLFMPYPPRSGYFTISALTVLVIGIFILYSRKNIKVDKTVLLLLAVFAAYDSIFIFRKGFSFSLLRAYAFGLLTFVSVVVYLNRESINRLFKGLLLWAGLTFALSIAQFIGGDFFYIPYYFGYYEGFQAESLFNFHRITTSLGFNFAKTQLGGQMSFILPFLICITADHLYRGQARWIHITALAGLLALSFSRAAWVGVFAALFVAFIFRYKGYWKILLIFSLVFWLTIIAVRLDIREHRAVDLSYKNAPAPTYENKNIIKQTFNITSDVSVRTRLALNNAGINILKDYPFGGGAGLFREKYSEYKKPLISGIDPRSNITPHNAYVQMLVEKGILGLLIFIFIIGKVFTGLYKNALKNKDGYYLGILAGGISLLIYGFFHEILPDRMFWIAIGLAAALSQPQDERIN